ncbi:hypothetical protein ABVT39_000250 [Epinephelus coioides]
MSVLKIIKYYIFSTDVTLDRTLSFKNHLKGTTAKVKSWNNLLSKLAGAKWGISTSTLQTSAILCPSLVQVIHRVDTQLNTTMQMITGTIRTTPLPWLPVQSNIPPPHIRQADSHHLPIYEDIFNPPAARLPSRRPRKRSGCPRRSPINTRC